jgi:hypothetical protein
MLVRPLSPPLSRSVGLVRPRNKESTEAIELVSAALLKSQQRR